ncbi:MAG: CPBP family intramembrane metalloprotease [Oscillospiraceae bacterium]|nr:CPBP family intramembrane metalloprotease [Oscillospiraceae bacterium]
MPAILTVLLFVGLNFIFVAIIGITDLMRHFPPHNLVKQFITSGSLTMRILAVGLFAPVVEELMCRGILLTRLSTWMPTWAAVLVSSALFGFIHLNLLQGMYAFVAGIFFALLYIRYRNLWLPIIAHVAFNLASIILHERLEAMGAEAFSLLLLLISSLLVAVVCALLLKKCTKAAVLIQEPGDGAEASSVIYP